MKSIYLPILTVVMDITISSGIFDKTICWQVVTGGLKDFFIPLCICNIKKEMHPPCNFFLLKRQRERVL